MNSRALIASVIVASCLFGHATANYAADWGIGQLMQALAQVRSSHVDFSEKKSIALLDQPVISSGELFYSAPDHFEKRTLVPKLETLTLDGDSVLITRGTHHYTLQLSAYPALAAFIDGIRGTLAGDRTSLERNYALNLDGTKNHWTLQLTPTADPARAQVARIRIEGANDALRRIEIDQTDGDSSVMTITEPVNP